MRRSQSAGTARIRLPSKFQGIDNDRSSMNIRINHVAVWILIVIYFLIGWGWYAIWGDTWLNLHAKTATDIERTHAAGAYVLAFIASIVVNYALAWLIS